MYFILRNYRPMRKKIILVDIFTKHQFQQSTTKVYLSNFFITYLLVKYHVTLISKNLKYLTLILESSLLLKT